MKTHKKVYPMDGPPLHVQATRLNPASKPADRTMVKSWVKANKHGRAKTLNTYTY